MIIAVDGPAGAGKTTIAKKLAELLNIKYIDSGAIYRTMTLYGMETFSDGCQGNEDEIADYFKSKPERLKVVYKNQAQQMWLKDRDISNLIRTMEVTAQVRYIADNADCRKVVNAKAREIAQKYSVVAEGRDIGSKVFPQTPHKFYLDSQVSVRAERRAKELGLPPAGEEFKQLLKEIRERDFNDMNRTISPLYRAEDACFIDASNLSIEQAVEKIRLKVEALESSRSID